jgi:O-antigen ligase
VLAAGAVLWYAIPEGSYDIVARQENTLVVWLVVGLGVLVGLVPRSRPPRGGVWALLALALLVAWTALSFLWTSSDERTLAELVRVLQYSGVVLLVWFVVSPSTWRPVAAGLSAAAIAVCGLALASRLAPGHFPDEIADAFDTKRLSYPLGYWNAVSAWGAMSVALALVWSAHARTLGTRAASLAATPLAVLVVYLTYSRAGAGGIGIALLAALILSVNRWTVALHAAVAGACSACVVLVTRKLPEIADGRGVEGAPRVLLALTGGAIVCALAVLLTRYLNSDGWRLGVRVARASTVVISVVLVVGFAVFGRGPVSDAWDDFRSTNVAPTPESEVADRAIRLGSLRGDRYEVWSSAVRGLRDEPLHGLGAGTFEYHWNAEGGSLFIRDAHSLYLEQAAELGLPGLMITLAVLLALGALGVSARVRLRDPSHAGAAAAMCAAFAVYLFHAGVDWMWESTAVSVLAFAVIAVATGAAQRGRPAFGWRPRVGLAMLSLCVFVLALPGLLSIADVRASREAFREGDLAAALEEADSAVSRQPWAASSYVQRALVRWADGDFAAAAKDFAKAREREPLDWRHPLQLARLEADRGRPRASLAAFREAQRLRPGSPFTAPSPRPGAGGR